MYLLYYYLCGTNDLVSKASIQFFLFEIIVAIFPGLITGLLYMLFSGHRISDTISVNYVKQKLLWPMVALGMAVAMIANYATEIVSNNFSLFGLNNTIDFDNASDSFLVNILYIVSTSVVPALIEEFVFRGIVMGSLRKYGDLFAIITSSILFAAMHGNIEQIPFAFILGLSFSYIDCKTNSLIPSILIHFFNNFYAVISDILNANSIISIRQIYMTRFILAAIFCVLGIMGFIYLVKKDKSFFKLGNVSQSTSEATSNMFQQPNSIMHDAAALKFKDKIISFLTNPGIIIALSAFIIETVQNLGFINV